MVKEQSALDDERTRQMQIEIQQLAAHVKRLEEATAVENVLAQGFERLQAQLEPIGRLPEQLAPLRDLTPSREAVPEEAAEAVSDMLAAMKGVRLPGGSLGIQEENVLFIGQAFIPADEILYPAAKQQTLGGGIQP